MVNKLLNEEYNVQGLKEYRLVIVGGEDQNIFAYEGVWTRFEQGP